MPLLGVVCLGVNTCTGQHPCVLTRVGEHTIAAVSGRGLHQSGAARHGQLVPGHTPCAGSTRAPGSAEWVFKQ